MSIKQKTTTNPIEPDKWSEDVKDYYDKFIAFLKEQNDLNGNKLTEQAKNIFCSVNRTMLSIRYRKDKTKRKIIIVAITLFYISRFKNLVLKLEQKDIIADISNRIGIQFALQELAGLIGVIDLFLPNSKNADKEYEESLRKTLDERSLTKSMMVEMFLLVYELKTNPPKKTKNEGQIPFSKMRKDGKTKDIITKYQKDLTAFIKTTRDDVYCNDNYTNIQDIEIEYDKLYKNGLAQMFCDVHKTVMSIKRQNGLEEVSRIRILAIIFYYLVRIKPVMLLGLHKTKNTWKIRDVSIDYGINFIITELMKTLNVEVNLSAGYRDSLYKTLLKRSITKSMFIEMFILIEWLIPKLAIESTNNK